MPGRKPEYRLMHVEDNGKGKKVWTKVGAGWNNSNGFIGIEINMGLPVVLGPHTKLVLCENKEGQEPPEDTSFGRE